MSVADDFRAIVSRLREWGFTVVEWSGCYGRSNGGGWSGGRPVGHINHHYVCSLNPDQGYINGLVTNLANGTVVNWFADVHGVAYLIGTGPMNHAGTGNQSVLDRTRADQPPPGPASSPGSISGNSHYSGTECQHPGDSTPWPTPMLDVMVAINAAEFLAWGYSADRAINHFEWTNRKIDMSAGGGANSGGWAGDELRHRVAARMTGTVEPVPEEETYDMAALLKDSETGWFYSLAPNSFCALSTDNGGVNEVQTGADAGLWPPEPLTLNWVQLAAMRDKLCPAGSPEKSGIYRTDGTFV